MVRAISGYCIGRYARWEIVYIFGVEFYKPVMIPQATMLGLFHMPYKKVLDI